MRGAKILVTGPTGQVATPVTLALAADNEVWGAARFSDAAARERLEKAGVTCAVTDLVGGDFSALPTDFDYVVNLAVAKTGNWGADLAANAESTGLLMAHCRTAKAFLHCSSAAVYAGSTSPQAEDAALGDNHRAMFPTYSISKITAEVVARTMARHLGLPTTIARLSVPYGDNGGWPYFHLEMILAGQPVPVFPGGPQNSLFNPIHEDDIIASVPRLLEAATVPATTVNWGGPVVGIHEWCAYLGELVGKEPTFVDSDQFSFYSTQADTSAFDRLVGATTVDWHDGMKRMVAHFHPELSA